MNRNAYLKTHELLSELANERVNDAREVDDATDRLINLREGLKEMIESLDALLTNLQKKREELMADTPVDDMAKPHGGSPIPQNSET